jgi:hypothetical protein
MGQQALRTNPIDEMIITKQIVMTAKGNSNKINSPSFLAEKILAF